MPQQKIYIQWKTDHGEILSENTWDFEKKYKYDIPFIAEQDFSSENTINEFLCEDCKPYHSYDSCECDWCFAGQMKEER